MATTTIVGQRWKVYVYADSTALVPGDGEGMVLSGITGFEASRVFVMGDGTSTVAQLVAAKQYQAIYAYADVDDVVLAGGYQYAVTDIPGSTLYVQIITGDGTHTVAELVANIVSSRDGITVVTGDYTILETDKKIIVNTADEVDLTITAGLSLYKDIEIERIVASTNLVQVLRSGIETINGGTSFVTHGATVASIVNNEIIRITKTGATTWKWVTGEVYSEVGVKKTWRKPNGRHRAEITGTTASAAGASVSVAHGVTAAKIISIIGLFITSGGASIPFNFFWEDGNSGYRIIIYANINDIVIANATGYTNGARPFTVIFEYTD